MSTPKEYWYSKSHEWVKYLPGGKAEIGLTDYAQSELGDIVFINLPSEGDKVEKDKVCCDVESVKAVSDVYSPIDGTVSAVNGELDGAPEKVNQDPYGTYLFVVEDAGGHEGLLSAEEYDAFVEQEKNK